MMIVHILSYKYALYFPLLLRALLSLCAAFLAKYYGRTDGRRDIPFYRDARTHLKRVGRGGREREDVNCDDKTFTTTSTKHTFGLVVG